MYYISCLNTLVVLELTVFILPYILLDYQKSHSIAVIFLGTPNHLPVIEKKHFHVHSQFPLFSILGTLQASICHLLFPFCQVVKSWYWICIISNHFG